MKQQQQDNVEIQNDEEYDSSDISDYSSEDEDAVLLTQKVQEKLLQTVARLRNKDPSIYQTVNPIFKDEDFEDQQNQQKQKNDKNNKKFTYKDMLKQGLKDQEQSQEEDLPPAMQEKKAKNKFKQALKKQKNVIEQQGQQDDLFTVKGKLKKEKNSKSEQTEDKFEEFMKKMKPESKKLIKSVWQNPQKMDETDIFLRDYIVGKKWLSKHINDEKAQKEFQKIDEEDEERSVEMDEHQAKYNFRYQEPDGDKIVQYPRKIQQSMRIKPQSRKDKRKKVQQRKKQEQKKVREQAQKKKEQLRTRILNKLQQNQQQTFDQEAQQMDPQEDQYDENLEHDWFFCDDCGKAFHEEETNYQCQECEDYMLCEDCYEIIIHKHPLHPAVIPIGFGAPKESVSAKILSKLQPCKTCRRRIPETVKHYSYEDRAKNVQLLCDRCYDQSPLDVKKKFLLVEAKINESNIQEVLQKDPEKIKELTNSKEIQQMVDEYLKYEFEDVIGDGIKTKFKYVNVKPEDYGLSDEQILFGDDKQLNKYVSIKKLAPYRDSKMKLRNNIYRKKVATIDKTVSQNKKLIEVDKIDRKLRKSRLIDKLKRRTEVMKKRRQTKLKILNISNPAKQKQVFVPSSRLASYGVTLQNKQQQTSTPNHKNKTKQ